MKREWTAYIQENAEYWLVQMADAHDLEGLAREQQAIADAVGVPFSLIAVTVERWNDELSPWEAPPVFGKQGFGGGAAATLRALTDTLLPAIRAQYNVPDMARFLLGGYSLAALFALWCGYESDAFYAVAAASPSVWFPGWADYAASHPFRAQKAALSLGDKEAHTRNRTMATVADNIKKQEQLFRAQGIPCSLEWHPGNHFQDSELRTAKAFIRVMQE